MGQQRLEREQQQQRLEREQQRQRQRHLHTDEHRAASLRSAGGWRAELAQGLGSGAPPPTLSLWPELYLYLCPCLCLSHRGQTARNPLSIPHRLRRETPCGTSRRTALAHACCA